MSLRRSGLHRAAGVVSALACIAGAAAAPAGAAVLTTHPRLLITSDDLPRLRSWATEANPMYAQALEPVVGDARRLMDDGTIPGHDDGSYGYVEYPTESYAELFAFMSLIDPAGQAARDDDGHRARTLLMWVMDHVRNGAAGENWVDPHFAGDDGDRARWYGEGFALALDWAYPYFSAADKTEIRDVFLGWAPGEFTGYPQSSIEGTVPTPSCTSNDPALVSDPGVRRWSLNNYWAAHTRNLGLMALALDPADDPGAKPGEHPLHDYLRPDLECLLWVIDRSLRVDATGGLAPEGFEYSPQTISYVAQLLDALATSGNDDTATWGEQVAMGHDPFWQDHIAAFLSSLPPTASAATGGSAWRKTLWLPAWFGATQHYYAPDEIDALAPVALYDQAHGDTSTAQQVRWIETNVPAGGADALYSRAKGDPLTTILSFLLFDPAAGAPADPRPSLPLDHFASGMGRWLSRTCWCDSARFLYYGLSWNGIDHQFGDGNDFGFWRDGEWLTKGRSGYNSTGSYTDYMNSVSIQNTAPDHNAPDDRRHSIWVRGDQWVLEPAGDPTIVARSAGTGYRYVTGDATNLYNSPREGNTDVTAASRSLVWLQPDRIVVYDRADTGGADGIKRQWFQLPAMPAVDGHRATMTSPTGQQLFVTTLLPADATIAGSADATDSDPSVPWDTSNPEEAPMDDGPEPMQDRLMVAATGDPRSARFLDVLQGADAGASADPATVLHSASGTAYDGAATAGTAVLFPRDLAAPFTGLTVDLPAGTTRVLVTGLAAGSGYAVGWATTDAGLRLTVAAGGATAADGGGVLDLAPQVASGGSGPGSGGDSSGGSDNGSGAMGATGATPSSGGTALTGATGGTGSGDGAPASSGAPPSAAALGLRALLAAVLAPEGLSRASVLAARGATVSATPAVSGLLEVRWRLRGGSSRGLLIARGRLAVQALRPSALHIRLTRAGRSVLARRPRVAVDATATFASAASRTTHRVRSTLQLR